MRKIHSKVRDDKKPSTTICRYPHVSSAISFESRLLSLEITLPSTRDEVRERLTREVKRVFDDEKSRPGALRIVKRLTDEGFRTHRKMVAKIMKTEGWRAKAAKKYNATTNSNHSLPVAPNLLNQHFEADHPDQKWVSDMTYIWADEGWLYLAVVLDLYARRVVGWAISERMTATLVCDALTMAL